MAGVKEVKSQEEAKYRTTGSGVELMLELDGHGCSNWHQLLAQFKADEGTGYTIADVQETFANSVEELRRDIDKEKDESMQQLMEQTRAVHQELAKNMDKWVANGLKLGYLEKI